ncbi:MAG: DUF2341 domain-containing protein [Fibrobacteria bacterium]
MKRLAILGLATWLLTACGERLAGGGDATETGSARVSGQVVLENGRPIAGAEVFILPADYNPMAGAALPDSQKDTTDTDGRYRFTRLGNGNYNLQVQHSGTHTRSLFLGIRLAIDPAVKDSVSVPEDTLRAPGSVSIPLPENRDSGIGYVFIPGTTFRKRVGSEEQRVGSVLLDSLPAGRMPSVEYIDEDPDAKRVELASDVGVQPGALTNVNAYATWGHSAVLALNTSASGVAIATDQTDFPLLVRLASPAFDFSAATPGGADLRFSKPDGRPLVREIQSWDAQAGKAEIWVRLDTVHAGMASQSITMHWGKSDAVAPLSGGRVFDTSVGFAGVWHMEEDAADTSANGLYKDATGGGSNGDDRVRNKARIGVVGAGHGLDSGDYIQAPKASNGLRLANRFTVSGWYRNARGNGPLGGEILSVGDNYGFRVRNDSNLHLWYWPAVPRAGAGTDWNGISVKSAAFVDGNWHQVFGSFDGAGLRLYVDGIEQGYTAYTDPVGLQFPVNVTMGKHGNGKTGFEFKGEIDETQVHSRVRNADWIKLSYENQKPAAKFPAEAGP